MLPAPFILDFEVSSVSQASYSNDKNTGKRMNNSLVKELCHHQNRLCFKIRALTISPVEAMIIPGRQHRVE